METTIVFWGYILGLYPQANLSKDLLFEVVQAWVQASIEDATPWGGQRSVGNDKWG